MDIVQLIQWLTGGPDFTPFMGVQNLVTVLFGLVLAVIALFGIWLLLRGAFYWGTAGKDVHRRAEGKADVKQGALQIVGVFAASLVLTMIANIANTIFGGIDPNAAVPAQGSIVLLWSLRKSIDFRSALTTLL